MAGERRLLVFIVLDGVGKRALIRQHFGELRQFRVKTDGGAVIVVADDHLEHVIRAVFPHVVRVLGQLAEEVGNVVIRAQRAVVFDGVRELHIVGRRVDLLILKDAVDHLTHLVAGHAIFSQHVGQRLLELFLLVADRRE